MRWYELRIRIYDLSLEEAINAFLFELGSYGIAIEEETNALVIKGYISEEFFKKDLVSHIDTFIDRLCSIFDVSKRPELYFNEINAEGWEEKWKEFFKPIKISNKLIITPPWERVPNKKHEHVIKIDPGPAFGTGYHPTTRLCLQVMEELCKNMPHSWKMLDVGTGSGILAMYGYLLGADKVLAIDIDPVALKWARHNLKLNNISDKIELSSIHIHDISEVFDIITANMLLHELKPILSHLRRIAKRWIIISGTLREQYKELQSLLKSNHMPIVYTKREEDWICTVSKI